MELTTKRIREFGLCEDKTLSKSLYIDRMGTSEEDVNKQPHRDKVTEFFLKHMPAETLPHLLTLPGIYWAFERDFAIVSGRDCRFIGLEWSWPVLEKSRLYMPGSIPGAPWSWRLRIGDVLGYKSDRAMLLYARAGSFMSLTNKDLVINFDNQPKWVHHHATRFRLNSHVWLDTNNTWSDELKQALRGIPRFVDRRLSVVPFAVTFLACREPYKLGEGNPVDKRCRAVTRELEKSGLCRFEFKEAYTYLSVNGMPMFCGYGLLHKRKPPKMGVKPDCC